MSQLNVNIIKNRVGSNGPTISGNTTISGILTATSFSGDGSGLTNINAGGDGTLDSLVVTGVSTFTGNTEFDGNVTIGGTLTYRDVTNIDAVGMITARKGVQILADGLTVTGVSTLSNGASIPDNQFLNIGNDSDLRLYHTGTASFIEDQGTGNFIIGSNGGVLKITKGADTENMAVFTPDGPAALYYDSVKKFETTDTGVNITGGINATGVNITGGINATGVITATSFSGDGSQLQGVESGVYDFVASGTIPNGATVVINTDGTVGIVTVTGSPTPSVGSEVVFNTGITNYTSATYDSANGKVVIAYKDAGNSSGTAIVGTVSGTSISFGSEVVFNTGITGYTSPIYDSANGKVVIAYRDNGNSTYGTAIVGTVSGTSISFGSEVVFNAAATNFTSPTYDSANGKVVIAYEDTGNSNYGTAVVFGSDSLVTNLTSENYIGIAAESISNGATGKITTVGGVNTSQTGLTTAKKYYVQSSGGIGTVTSNPSVVAGTSVSDTKIVVR